RLVLGWHTGVEIGGNPSYGGTRFFADSPGVTSTELMSIGAGDSNVRITNNLYVPIVYDRDNTAYYVNPASDSVMNRIVVGANDGTNHRTEITWGSLPTWGTSGKSFFNSVATYGVDDQGLILQAGYSGGGDVGGLKITDDGIVMWGAGDEDLFRMYNEDTSFLSMQVTDGDNAYFYRDVRSPVFYDSDDTGYRIDGAGTSRVLTMAVGQQDPSTRFHVWGNHGDSTLGVSLRPAGNGAGRGEARLQMWVSEPGNTWEWGGFGYNIRADVNDGSTNRYYFSRINTNFGASYMRFSTDGTIYFYGGGGSTMYDTMQIYPGSYINSNYSLRSDTDLRSPIYYDSNDTSWRIDPTDYSYVRYFKVRSSGTSSYTRALSVYSEGQGEINFGSYPGAWTSAVQIQSNDNNYYMWLSPLTGYNGRIVMMNAGLEIWSQSNNFSTVFYNNQLRTGYQYDNDDTTYYMDLNSSGFSIFARGAIGTRQYAHPNGTPWNHQIWLGRYDNLLGSYPVYVPGAAYGLNVIQDSDGLFLGMITRGSSSNDYNAVFGWGDDAGDIIQYRFNNGVVAQMDYGGGFFTPIMYDNNDSGYYLDPNSTSDSALRIRGGALHGPNPSWGQYMYVGSNGRPNSWGSAVVTNGNLHLDCQNGYSTYINHYSGNITYLYDTRPNVIYDRDDTYYYLDINGGNRLNYITTRELTFIGTGGDSGMGASAYAIFQEGGGWGYPYPDLRIAYHTGIKLGGYYGYQGIRMYNNHDMGSLLFEVANTNNYMGTYNWNYIGTTGIYTGYNGAHWYPNYNSSYGSWRGDGNRNGWYGYNIGTGNNPHVMFDGSGNGGMYMEGYGRWLYYHYLPYNCIGINTSSTSPSYGMYVSGGIYATGNIVAYSDARKKTEILTIDNPLEKVLQLRGVYYSRIPDTAHNITGENAYKKQTGVIAQETLKVFPEVVTYDEVNDEYGVSYGNFAGLFIETFKEQQKQIKELKEEIEKLKEIIFNNKG
ncbi:MAG: Vibrio phage nt, partial [Bacteroidota bacterium]